MQSYLKTTKGPLLLKRQQYGDYWYVWLDGDVTFKVVEGCSELDAQEKLIVTIKGEDFEVVEMFSQDGGKTFVNEVVR